MSKIQEDQDDRKEKQKLDNALANNSTLKNNIASLESTKKFRIKYYTTTNV